MAHSSLYIMSAKLFKVFVKDTCFKIEIDETSQQPVKDVVQNFKKALFNNEVDKNFCIASYDELMHEIERFFKPAPAAGGLVKNPNGEILWIFRRGKYDLPKGKLDEGETFLEAALREVEEECGLHDLKAGSLIGYTYHIYIQNENPYFKKTAWYEMFTNQDFVELQTEEDITDYCWANPNKHVELSKLTYKSLKDLLKRFLREA